MTTRGSDSERVEIRIGPWIARVDREHTRPVYKVVKEGGARGCGCDMCLNFDWHRRKGRALTPVAVNLLAELGVEPSKEAEAVHHGLDKDGHLYEWWYHSIGEVVGGPEPTEPVRLDEGLSVIVRDGRAIAHEGFENYPLVEVLFFRHLSWALAMPEPK